MNNHLKSKVASFFACFEIHPFRTISFSKSPLSKIVSRKKIPPLMDLLMRVDYVLYQYSIFTKTASPLGQLIGVWKGWNITTSCYMGLFSIPTVKYCNLLLFIFNGKKTFAIFGGSLPGQLRPILGRREPNPRHERAHPGPQSHLLKIKWSRMMVFIFWWGRGATQTEPFHR